MTKLFLLFLIVNIMISITQEYMLKHADLYR